MFAVVVQENTVDQGCWCLATDLVVLPNLTEVRVPSFRSAVSRIGCFSEIVQESNPTKVEAIATSSKKLLVAPGIATSSKKLVGTSALLVVTSATLLETRSY